MRSLLMIWIAISGVLISFAQTSPPKTEQENSRTEQQLENLTEANEAETEDDSFLQELESFKKHPINLNTADREELQQLQIVSEIQINNLLAYRTLLGNLISIYELQAVPGWDLETINRIKYFVTTAEKQNIGKALLQRFSSGKHTLLLRSGMVLEKSKGYLIDPAAGTNYYLGDKRKYLLRYKYNYHNLLQYGLTAEKDAGEEFFKGSQKQGFDFYSAHLFIRKLGIIKSLALGDFAVNLGQGLTQWMSMAFKKGPDITSIKRQSETLRPYNSVGEIYFHRGVGVTLEKKKWEATIFASLRKLDANFITDSLITTDDYVSSFQTSGYHRTASEIADKNVQRQLAFGGKIKWRHKALSLAFNTIQYRFKYALQKRDEPYNQFAFSGTQLSNYSIDYGYTYRNVHLFGEVATNGLQTPSMLHGALVSLSAKVDASLMYRNINREYKSFYANAFTENTFPTNEQGIYAGICIRPVYQWRIDAYVDFFKFPWLKYRVDAPSSGSEYFVQVLYKPNKQFEWYSRFRNETKPLNETGMQATNFVTQKIKKNLRTQFSYKFNSSFTLRSRAEMVWYDMQGPDQSRGFQLFSDFLYKPLLRRYSLGGRIQYFETDDYNSRLYSYENDVLYYYSIPAVFGKGFKVYFNFSYDFSKKMSFWLKISQLRYQDQNGIGSALDFISKPRKTEIRTQLILSF